MVKPGPSCPMRRDGIHRLIEPKGSTESRSYYDNLGRFRHLRIAGMVPASLWTNKKDFDSLSQLFQPEPHRVKIAVCHPINE